MPTRVGEPQVVTGPTTGSQLSMGGGSLLPSILGYVQHRQVLEEQKRQFNMSMMAKGIEMLMSSSAPYIEGGPMEALHLIEPLMVNMLSQQPGMNEEKAKSVLKTLYEDANLNPMEKLKALQSGYAGLDEKFYTQFSQAADKSFGDAMKTMMGATPEWAEEAAGIYPGMSREGARPPAPAAGPQAAQPPAGPVPTGEGTQAVTTPQAQTTGGMPAPQEGGMMMPQPQTKGVPTGAVTKWSNIKTEMGEWVGEGKLKIATDVTRKLPTGHPANVSTLVRTVLSQGGMDLSASEQEGYQEAVRKANLDAFKEKWAAQTPAWKKDPKYGAGLSPDDPKAWSRSGLLLETIEFPPLPGSGDYNAQYDPTLPERYQKVNEKVLEKVDNSAPVETRVKQIQTLKYPKGWLAKHDWWEEIGRNPEVTNRVFGVMGGGIPGQITPEDVQRGFQAVTDILNSTPSRVARIGAEAKLELYEAQLENMQQRLSDTLAWAGFAQRERFHEDEMKWNALQLQVTTGLREAEFLADQGSKIDQLVKDARRELTDVIGKYGDFKYSTGEELAKSLRKHPDVKNAWDNLAMALSKKEGIPPDVITVSWSEGGGLIDWILGKGWEGAQRTQEIPVIPGMMSSEEGAGGPAATPEAGPTGETEEERRLRAKYGLK